MQLVQLGDTSSLSLLEGLQNDSSDLWTWGSAPMGYITLNNGSVAGAVTPEADRSVMETPSEAVRQDVAMSRQGAPSSFVLTEGFGKSTKGVFDSTGFKASAQAQWPRVYP